MSAPRSSWPDALARLRQHRNAPPRDQSIGPLVRELTDRLDEASKKSAGCGAAWAQACPPKHLPRTSVRGLARGVLTIAVDSAATRYELDRWLRAGGEQAVISAARAGVRKVKLVPGEA